MEHFAIHCTTCKARLIVKDESVIGQILACPKCNSMVQVVPPVGWKRPGQAESADAPADLPPAAPAAVAKPAQATRPKAAAVVPPALPPRPATTPAAVPEPVQPSAAAAAPKTAPVGVSAVAARAKQEWWLVVGGVLGGVALGLGAWLVIALQSPEPQVVAQAVAAKPVEPAPPALETKAAEANPDAAPAAETPAVVDKPASIAAPAETALPVAERGPEAEPASEPATPAETPPRDASPAPVEAGASTAPAPEPSKPALKLEPLAPEAVSGALAPAASGEPSAADASSEPAPESNPPQAPDEPAAPQRPQPLSSAQIEQRLGVVLASVEFADVPLSQFVTFIADVSGVPVRLDEAALAKAGLARGTKVRLKLQDTTAGAALRAVVDRAGLTYTVSDDGRIVVTTRTR